MGEQDVDVRAVVRRERDAHARVQEWQVLLGLRELGELHAQAVRRHRCIGGAVGAVEDDDELVAADPHQDVVGADAGSEPFGSGAQDPVTEAVPVLVIDELEPVEVDQEHRDPVRPRCPAQHGRHPLVELDPAGDAGERIRARRALERVALVGDLGHVAADAEHADEVVVVVELRHEADLPHGVRSVVARRTLLHRARAPAVDHGQHCVTHAVVRPGCVARHAAEQFVAAAEVAGHRGVDVRASRLCVPAGDVVDRVLGQRPELPLARGDLPLGAEQVADLAGDRDRAHDPAIRFVFRVHHDVERAELAVGIRDRHRHRGRRPGLDHLAQQPLVLVDVQRPWGRRLAGVYPTTWSGVGMRAYWVVWLA